MASKRCWRCTHYRQGELACDAYPNGIPEDLLSGEADHSQPFPGDQGIRYEPRGAKDRENEPETPE